MTVLDLTALHPTVASCYQRFIDPKLPHQLTLEYALNKTAVRGRCNCGVKFTPRRPEVEGTMEALKADYAAHVSWVTR